MKVHYHRASADSAADDADLRALLRGNPMPSWVQMAMVREPSFFAGSHWFGSEWALLARDAASGQAVGMCSEASHTVHCNGQPVRMGYLGALRMAPAGRQRIGIVRGGFAAVRAAAQAAAESGQGQVLPLWYTSISADNHAARRLLEAPLKDMPRYWYLNDMHTLVLPAARGQRHGLWHAVPRSDWSTLFAWHNQQAARYQLSPALEAAVFARHIPAFYAAHHAAGGLLACMALWNPQPCKQVLVQGYRQPLAALRPACNLYARLARRVPLPAPGQVLAHTFMAFFATAPAVDAATALALVQDALALAPSPALTLGLHGAHPWLPVLQARLKPWCYRTRIYAVNFENSHPLDARVAQPEVAVL